MASLRARGLPPLRHRNGLVQVSLAHSRSGGSCPLPWQVGHVSMPPVYHCGICSVRMDGISGVGGHQSVRVLR